MNASHFAQALLVIIAVATCLGLVGVWFPEFWRTAIGPKLFYTFLVVAASVAVAAAVLKYLPHG